MKTFIFTSARIEPYVRENGSLFPGKWELYDLEKDRTELNDLSAKYSERVKKMSKLWFDIAKNKDRLGKKGLNPVKDQLKNLSFRKDTSGQVKE